MDYQDIIESIRPNSERIIRGNCYEGLEWLDTLQSKPTKEECEIAQNNLEKLSYREQRRAKYPSFADLADALVHQAEGNDIPFAEYVTKCLKVKEQFPKSL
jgi:hypothetical protein